MIGSHERNAYITVRWDILIAFTLVMDSCRRKEESSFVDIVEDTGKTASERKLAVCVSEREGEKPLRLKKYWFPSLEALLAFVYGLKDFKFF